MAISEHVYLYNKTPLLFGDDNRFMTLGLLGIRGDRYVVMMDLVTGSVHIEETFTATALGDKMVGFEPIEDDTVWKCVVYAANSYGLTSQKHIAACVKHLGLSKKNKVINDILNGIPPQSGKNIGK